MPLGEAERSGPEGIPCSGVLPGDLDLLDGRQIGHGQIERRDAPAGAPLVARGGAAIVSSADDLQVFR